MPEDWLTTKDAAKRISVSMGFIRKLIQTAKIRAVNVGVGEQRHEWRVSAGDLERFMNENANTTK